MNPHLLFFIAFFFSFTHSLPILGVVSQPFQQFTVVVDSLPIAMMPFGALFVPLQYDLSDSQLSSIMHKLNGVVFTGGAVQLCSGDKPSDWTMKVKRIVDQAVQFNDQGIYFPIWGSCQGLEVLSIIVAEECSVLTSSPAYFYPSNVQYTPALKSSRLMADFDPQILKQSERQSLTFNNHGYGIRASSFLQNKNLHNFFSLVATARDSQDNIQAAIIEARDYPIYATMFHPEQTLTFFQKPINFIRPVEAILYSQSFFRFFVGETMKNDNTMSYSEFQARNLEKDPLTIAEIKTPGFEAQYTVYIYE